MKLELEYFHEADNSKVWIIEQKLNKVIVQFGKKGSNLQTNEKNFKNEADAKKEFVTKVKEKLNKGYVVMNKNKKLSKKMEKKGSKTKKNQLAQSVEIINPVVSYLIQMADKYAEYQEKLYEKYESDEGEDIFDNNMNKFHQKNSKLIMKTLEKLQNKKVSSFYKSGIIIKSISKKLKEETLENINQFANKTSIDYHPGSDNKVRDIVHPSLYPYIKKTVSVNHEGKDFWNRPYEQSKYQWLPSEFKIDANGKCKIESYINNLPETEVNLYKNIENVFESVLPYFEDIWSYINSIQLYDEDTDWLDHFKKDGIYKQLSLKNKNLQVITKIVRITLKEGQESIGAWHVEGMSHENIVGTVTITLEQTEKFSSELFFKRIYSLAEAQDIVYSIPQNPYSEMEEMLNKTYIPLGKISIKESNVIAFPNSHIHKIDMKNTSKKEQQRTLLVFWLINPNIRITSTKDIKQQNYNIEEAKKHRLELMKERTYYKQTFNQRDLNLCEH